MNEKIKVAHILHSVGGVDVYLRLVTENTNPDFFEHIIIHQQDKNKEKYLDKNNASILEYKIPIQREINFIKDIKSILTTIKILKKEKPNAIHAHSAKGGIIARVASLFYKVKVLHTPHAYSFLSADSKFKKRLFLIVEKVFKRFNSILLATSESEINRGLYDVGYRKDKTILFNNSILPILMDTNKQLDFDYPKEYICTVGRPSFQKNTEMMIEVLKKVKEKIPKIHLVIMGVGEYSPNTEKIQKLISKYDLESNVTMIEWVDRTKIFQLISSAKLYISTSRYEGLPYSIIESLALEKSCVVTDCDGNRDLVQNKYNGFIVDIGDIDLMSNRIITLYFDDKLREKFQKNSLLLFEEKFNLNKNIDILESIYKKYSNSL